ncbi:hypothetical protein LTR22_010828 [Elasticomyces elasticus]|nr:hypothetical protein LTR22_010828 [Elasticomyces elasticus]
MARKREPPASRTRSTANLFRLTMNKFLNKKKAAPEGVSYNSDAFNALSSPPLQPTSPGLKKSATSRWKKQKKPIPEPKPELNLAGVLPSTDDFRTSLLMPNLSARFSMLKEQDDPNSLIGKASDDSVLQPRRRSRMMDFGFGSNGLNDIAEVNSIRSSIRPPFAHHNGRQESFNSEDGYGSENESSRNGSVLARSRPGEGNVLFGGRQKVYKIASNGASSAKLGKAVYEDDIGMSAFQRYRKEREASETWQTEDEPSFDFGLDQTGDVAEQEEGHATTPNDSAKDLSDTTKELMSHSPSLSSYENKRLTTSSTARSEARSSTAATSIASQPAATAPSPLVAASHDPAPIAPMSSLKRSDTKTRRLYEQSLDQHVQEQQTSALTRLNSIQRSRTLNNGLQSPPLLYGSKSATNVAELKSQQPVYALSRAQSPPMMAPLTTFGSMRKTSSNNASPLASGPQSPVSPQAMDFPDLTQALEPGDRGKATAMGAFNKPAQQFDEQQYLQRQQQLQRSQSRGAMQRSASRGALSRSASRGALQRKDSLQKPAFQPRSVRPELPDRERSASNASIQQRIGRFEQVDRERSVSNASTRSRSRSAPKRHEPSPAYNVFQNAASQIQTKPGAQQYDTHRTFFGNISASDSEEEEDELRQEYDYGQSGFGYGGHNGRWQPAGLAPVSEHPAFRGHSSKPSLAEEDEDEEEDLQPQPLRPTPSSQQLRTDALSDTHAAPAPMDDIDSPTLGPSTSEPLNGMVHHLRQQSNQSSIYPVDESAPIDDEVPEMPGRPWSDRDHAVRSTIGSESRIESTYTSSNSNPWDLDDIDNVYSGTDDFERSSISPVEGMQRQSQFAFRAPSRATIQQDRHSEVSVSSESGNATPWQQELRKQHTRDASTATQAERDALDNELAARRNAVQEKMKSIVERETQSRGASPAPSAGGAFKAFGMLKSKSSRESVDVSRGASAPTKAMKMLGITGNASSVTLNSQYERGGYSLDVNRPRNDSGSRPPPVPSMQPRGPLNDWEQTRTRGDSEASKMNGRSPPLSDVSKARSRSNSEATTGRSRSRTGPYRDDLAQAMAMGTGSSAAGLPDLSPMVPRELTPGPSPEVPQSSFDGRSRARSTSRPPAPVSYFEAANSPMPNGRLAPNATTPLTLSPNVYTPGGSSARPSPAVSPIAQNPTPPLSGANTPVTAKFAAANNNPIVEARKGMLRKKTVSKFDISEPKLIASSSQMDTVDLPVGASLKNGMDEAPPLPPINPRRRATHKLFGMSRGGGVSEDAHNFARSKTPDPFGRSKTPDPWMNARSTTEPDFSGARDPRVRPGMPTSEFQNHSSPAVQQYAHAPPASSPERIERSPLPRHHGSVEGGMF